MLLWDHVKCPKSVIARVRNSGSYFPTFAFFVVVVVVVVFFVCLFFCFLQFRPGI